MTPPQVASGVAVIRNATTGRLTLVWPDDQPPSASSSADSSNAGPKHGHRSPPKHHCASTTSPTYPTPKPATAALDETGPQRWRCHTCRQTVTTYVELVEPPTCHGGWRHRPIPMYPDNERETP